MAPVLSFKWQQSTIVKCLLIILFSSSESGAAMRMRRLVRVFDPFKMRQVVTSYELPHIKMYAHATIVSLRVFIYFRL